MSNENIALVRTWFEEVWNQGRAEAIDELLADEAVVHGLGADLRGPVDFRSFQSAYRQAFPDVKLQLDEIVAQGDIVAARWTGKATHLGEGLGFAATGRQVHLNGMIFVRVERGKLVEGWNNFDQLGMLQQLGVVNLP